MDEKMREWIIRAAKISEDSVLTTCDHNTYWYSMGRNDILTELLRRFDTDIPGADDDGSATAAWADPEYFCDEGLILRLQVWENESEDDDA